MNSVGRSTNQAKDDFGFLPFCNRNIILRGFFFLVQKFPFEKINPKGEIKFECDVKCLYDQPKRNKLILKEEIRTKH